MIISSAALTLPEYMPFAFSLVETVHPIRLLLSLRLHHSCENLTQTFTKTILSFLL